MHVCVCVFVNDRYIIITDNIDWEDYAMRNHSVVIGRNYGWIKKTNADVCN